MNAKPLTPAADEANIHAEFEKLFISHPPKGTPEERSSALREKTKEYAAFILQVTPANWNKNLALATLTQVCALASAAIEGERGRAAKGVGEC